MSHSTFNLPTVTKLTKANKSFTLIEMLVVVVIIGILAGVLVPRLVGARERASDSARIVKVWQISSAIELYAQENGTTYPLAPLTTTGTSIARQDITDAISPYLTTIPTDPGKWTVAISTAPGNIQVTGDSFAYWTNAGWTVYAITALMESKKGNTTNGTGVIDSDKQGWYQKVGKGLITTIVAGWGWGGGSYAIVSGVTIYWTDIMVSDGTPANTYVIADRNVGATEAGLWTTSYGYHFQWGNNYGFPSSPALYTPNSTWLVDTSTYNWTNPYSNSTWIYGIWLQRYDWSLYQNDNLRWNTTNTNVARKWPCDPWYHIPTQAERQWLYNTWLSLNPWQGANWNLFRDTLKLPLAGLRDYDSASSVNVQGSYGYYWSSTPNGQYARTLLFFASYLNPGLTYYRALGFSVRCFKNSY